jgi:hypothetical protein
MPGEPKPKQFIATAAFSYRGERYAVGEPVEDRRTIERLVRYGDRFIKVKRAKTPAVDTATTPPESTKED